LRQATDLPEARRAGSLLAAEGVALVQPVEPGVGPGVQVAQQVVGPGVQVAQQEVRGVGEPDLLAESVSVI